MKKITPRRFTLRARWAIWLHRNLKESWSLEKQRYGFYVPRPWLNGQYQLSLICSHASPHAWKLLTKLAMYGPYACPPALLYITTWYQLRRYLSVFLLILTISHDIICYQSISCNWIYKLYNIIACHGWPWQRVENISRITFFPAIAQGEFKKKIAPSDQSVDRKGQRRDQRQLVSHIQWS